MTAAESPTRLRRGVSVFLGDALESRGRTGKGTANSGSNLFVGDLEGARVGEEGGPGNEIDVNEAFGETDVNVRVSAEILVGVVRRGRSASGIGGTQGTSE